jgi:hypothetical protein
MVNQDLNDMAQFLYNTDYEELTERKKTVVRTKLRRTRPKFIDLR